MNSKAANPYFNRIMIRNRQDFVGRAGEVERILSRIGAARPQSVAVVGDRRIGKSSLLHHLTDEVPQRRFLPDPDRYFFLYVDFEGLVSLEVDDFFALLLDEIAAEGGASIVEGIPPGYRMFGPLFRRLRSDQRKLVVLCDEFDAVTRNPRFDAAFFSALRAAANRYDLAFVTTAARELQELCHDQEVAGSPFFNIFSNLSLGPFLPEEARNLVRLSEDRGLIPLSDGLDFLLGLGGYLPFLLQIACASLYDARLSGFSPEAAFAHAECEFEIQARPHLVHLGQKLDVDTKAALLLLHRGGGPITERRAALLELAGRRGLVLTVDGHPKLFNPLLGRVLSEDADRTRVTEQRDGRVPSARFRVLEVLGEGGMGTVYRVLDQEIGEEIALKELSRTMAQDPLMVDRFRQEALLARKITSSRVCRIYEFYREDRRCWITMELIRGQSLAQFLSELAWNGELMPVRFAASILRDAAEGLAVAHRYLVHRDLKPANIMLTRDGHAVIMDFGIARANPDAMQTSHPTTGHGVVVGTPNYMAPEQGRGEEVDARADLFSLAVLGYRMLTGSAPFKGSSPEELRASQAAQTIVPPRTKRKEIPEDLSEAIARCLAYRREDRLPNAQAFLDAVSE